LDDEAEPAPLGVKRAQRLAKKAETKGRAPLAAKAGHTAVWAGAKAKAEDPEAGVDARERVGRKTTRATSAMTFAPSLLHAAVLISSKFKLLTKEQKVELAAWNKSNPKKDGTQKKRKANETNSKQSKARNELMAAMVESQTAGLTALNAEIASMTVGPTVGPSGETSVCSTITSNPHDMSVSHEVLAERARVALVKLQLILKPPSKKDKKKNP
jgi:hypothetical protein